MAPIVEKEPREDKVQEVASLRELIESSGAAILADYRGLNVKEITALRRKLRESDTTFRVVKNTLFKRAAAGTSVEQLVEGLEGPTAVAATNQDPIATAKALFAYIREKRSPIKVKGAIVDGQIMDANAVQALSTLPGKQELLAMVVGGLQGPIVGLTGTLNMLIVQAVMTLQAVADQKAEAA